MVSKLDQKQIDALAEKKLCDLLSIIDEKSVITFGKTTGQIFVGGTKIDDGRLMALKAEAEFILQSDAWKIIYESIKALAEKSMFIHGESLDDMKKGRSMLFLLSTQKKILDTLKSVVHKQQ